MKLAAALLGVVGTLACPFRASAAYTGSNAANAAAINGSVAVLAALGRPLRVGLLNVLPPGAPQQLGVDGFARLTSATSVAANAVLTAPLNSSVPVHATDVEGAVPWLFNWLATEAGVNVSYSIFRLPAALQSSSDSSAQVLAAMSAGQFDAVAVMLGVNPGRLEYMRLIPLQGYNYIVVTTRPAPTTPGTWDRAFVWVSPFTWRLWLVFAASVVLSALCQVFFEKGRHQDQFDNEAIGSNLEAVGHSFFLAVMGATLQGMFEPVTAAGRVYTATTAFCISLIMSIYLANLAAAFTTSPPLSAPIQDITSFVATGLPLCARNTTGQLSWLNSAYPGIAQNRLLVTPGADTDSVLNGIMSGACAGGISTTSDVSFALGVAGDPTGVFCNLLPVGPALDSFLYALPFTGNTTQLSPEAFDAVKKLFAYAISSGNYTSQALAMWMPDDTNRPQCASLVASNAAAVAFALSGALDVHDLAGVFFIQLAGLVVASLFHVSKSARKSTYAVLHARTTELWRAGSPLDQKYAGDHDISEKAREPDGHLAVVAARLRQDPEEHAGKSGAAAGERAHSRGENVLATLS